MMICASVWVMAEMNRTDIKKQVEVTKNVFNSIVFMPGSTLEDLTASNKINNVLVNGDFITVVDYEKIKAYYLKELKGKGWIFDDEVVNDKMGKDNYKELDFHKGKYVINLYYYEDTSNYGCNYAIAIEWNR